MISDLRYAIRMLLKSPGFTFIAVLTLALGIGANSAIFSVIDAVLLRSLPFPNPDRLTMIWASAPQHPGEERGVHSFPDYEDLRAQNHTFTALAAYTGASTIWGTGEESAAVPGIAATSDLFAVLGSQPILGRGFSREDEKAGAPRVVVITYPFWQKRFGGDPNIIGRQIKSALGAQKHQMLALILRQSLTMAAIGIALGILGAFAATRLLSALLFGVGTTDLVTYGAVIPLLGAAALLAAFFPARRAMKVDPIIALRYE